MKKSLLQAMMCLSLVLFLDGCNSMTMTTYDVATGKVQSVENISGDAVAALIYSCHDKIVVTWSSGWGGRVEVTPGSQKNPTPHFTAEVFNEDSGWASIPKEVKGSNIDWTGFSYCIMATRSNLSATPSGFVKTSGNQPLPTPNASPFATTNDASTIGPVK